MCVRVYRHMYQSIHVSLDTALLLYVIGSTSSELANLIRLCFHRIAQSFLMSDASPRSW